MKKGVWQKAALLEKEYGTREQCDSLLSKAVQYCPRAISLLLMAANEKWLAMDINGARIMLAEAFTVNEDMEDVWIASFRLEFESKQIERARKILEKARSRPNVSSPRIWMKSVLLERLVDDTISQRRLLYIGIKKYPTFWKLWIMLAQLEIKEGLLCAARLAFISGIRMCPQNKPLWLNYSDLEEKMGHITRARAILEQSCLKSPNDDHLWLASILFEIRAKKQKASEGKLAIAIQQCPRSGLLWSQAITMTTRQQRKEKCFDALKFSNNDPFVMCAVAQLFWAGHRYDHARAWFMKSITVNPDIGDLWAYLYTFELEHGTKEQQMEIITKCQAANPRHGIMWSEVSKTNAKFFATTASILEELASRLRHVFHRN